VTSFRPAATSFSPRFVCLEALSQGDLAMCTVGDGQHSWNQCNFVNVGNVGRGSVFSPRWVRGTMARSQTSWDLTFSICAHISGVRHLLMSPAPSSTSG
jgi:hypothetical protein